MDTLTNKHQYGNFTTMPTRQDGFPLDQECLSMTQNNIRLLAVLASLSGYDYVILSGCGTSGARKPGYVYMRTNGNLVGEVLYYDGSAPQSSVMHIVETESDVEANQTTYPQAYTERYLAGGASDTGVGTISWNAFQNVTLSSLSSRISSMSSSLSALDSQVTLAQQGAVPIGTIVPYMGTSAPTGWLFCNGQSYNKATYPALASVLGVTSSTFNVPNLAEKFLVGANSQKTSYNHKQTGGSSECKLTQKHIPEHQHSTTSSGYYVGEQGTGNPDGSMDSTTVGGGGSYPRKTKLASGIKTGTWGYFSPTPVPTIPPYYAINYIIRAK